MIFYSWPKKERNDFLQARNKLNLKVYQGKLSISTFDSKNYFF